MIVTAGVLLVVKEGCSIIGTLVAPAGCRCRGGWDLKHDTTCIVAQACCPAHAIKEEFIVILFTDDIITAAIGTSCRIITDKVIRQLGLRQVPRLINTPSTTASLSIEMGLGRRVAIQVQVIASLLGALGL